MTVEEENSHSDMCQMTNESRVASNGSTLQNLFDSRNESEGANELEQGEESTSRFTSMSRSRASSPVPENSVVPANIARQPSYPKSPRRRRRQRRRYGMFGLSYERWTSVLAIVVVILAIMLALSQNAKLRESVRNKLPSNVAGYISTLPSLRDIAIHNYVAFTNLRESRLADYFQAGMPGLPGFTENLSMLGLGITNIGQSLGSSLTLAPQNMLALIQPFQFPRPGLELRNQGLKPKHPVMLIPGFVTSGLELWETLPCASQQKRERVWGSWAMTSGFLLNKECWLKHLRLDEKTGLDPAGVKVRAGQGLEAVDYFLPGYHVWARMIEAFADFGLDSNNLVTEPYDWRLSPPKLQQRDGYFSKLKAKISLLVQLHGEKVVVISHSWGDSIFRIFMSWVSATEPHWVSQHIEAYANIGGPTLGVPKAVSSLLSGETRDTAELGYMVSMLINAHFSRAQRVELFRTWGAGLGMLPVGGTQIWGNATWAPDDPQELTDAGKTYGAMMTILESSDSNAEAAERYGLRLVDTFGFKPAKNSRKPGEVHQDLKHLDAEETMQLLANDGSPHFKKAAHQLGGIADKSRDTRCAGSLSDNHYSFSPLECPLPKAPNLKMFCMYGVGHDTERAYHYEHYKTQKAFDMAKRHASDDEDDPTELDVRYKLNSNAHNPRMNLDDGIQLADGDGTVPLISLGTLCRKHWKSNKLNPYNVSVTTREYKHEPLVGTYSPLNPVHRYQQLTSFSRGGPRSADHIDILSHENVLKDVLMMTAGLSHVLEDQISSDIDRIVKRIPISDP